MPGLLAHIRELIDKNGPLTVADYMELALQHPEFGYYRHGDPIGQGGDFITAPEISQMFGEMIGLWCADVWRQMGKPEKFALLELGPGRGTLMQDALRATAKKSGFHQAMELHLIESSETLRKQQTEKIGGFLPRYIDDLSQLPALPTLIIANEFFDALPVRQFEKTFQGWHERLIAVDGDRLGFHRRNRSGHDVSGKAHSRTFARSANPGTVYEISMSAMVLMRNLARHIHANGGAALVIDYGYAKRPMASPPCRPLPTIDSPMCWPIPARPISRRMSISRALAQAAQTQDVQISGPVGQGEFLQTLGIDLRAEQLKLHATPQQATDIIAALHRLTDPSQMGSLFKAMAIMSTPFTELPGF